MEAHEDLNNDLTASLTVLRSGGLILYPTDTIWGIGCDATNPDAVSKVYKLKQRAETKSLIVLMAGQRDILKYTTQPDLRIFDFLKTVQRPTTVIYDGAIGLAPNLINADGTIGIRLVTDDFCRHLIKRFRKPLVSTSANLSGERPPAFYREIDPRILTGVDYIVHHRRNDETPKQPSAIIKWNAGGPPTIIRP
ncbi:MAG TPA: L-threonylcarbamoyladenylate synthase [Puia sp.]|jgi:L-threonylcarbamoyladenylate synthase|nr:L-threonylcarbamoyladenylate synthase [Puia sp.]